MSPLASYQALIVRVTPPGPLMPLWMSMAAVWLGISSARVCHCLSGARVVAWGSCMGHSQRVPSRLRSSLGLHSLFVCGRSSCTQVRLVHCHSASRVGQCSHQGCCQRESSATTIARAGPADQAGCCAPSASWQGCLTPLVTLSVPACTAPEGCLGGGHSRVHRGMGHR